MRLFFILFLFFTVVDADAQCSNTVTPASATVSCVNGASPVSFTCACTNTGAVSARHDWYSPYNPYPNGQPIYSSTGLTSVLNGSFAPGAYIVATTQMPSMCVSLATFAIASPMAFPTFTASNSTPTLGCAPLLQTTLAILGAISNQTPTPAPCSFTFLPPSFAGVVNPSFSLSPNTATLANVPGTWTLIVRDDGNGCWNVLPVPVYQNTVQSTKVLMLPNSTTLTCNNPVLNAVATSTTPSTSVSWTTPTGSVINSGTIVLGPPNGPATSTALTSYGTYTVNFLNMANNCASDSIVVVSQNFRPPVSLPYIVGTNTAINCNLTDSVMLAESSTVTSNGPGAAITNRCWGLYPVANTCGLNTYKVDTPGLYMLSVKDSYNGCTASQTINIPFSNQLIAAMAHTVGAGGATSFSNTTANINFSTACIWNFGDGFAATGNNPSHTYGSAGVYTVSLIVTNGGSCNDTIQQVVNITGVPCVGNAGFSIVPTGTSQYWTIIPAYPWNVSNAVWSWGDGITSNGLYSSHSYSAAGNYTICLSVTVSCGATASACVTQNVPAPGFVQVVTPSVQVIGITEQENDVSQILVYPNPNDGKFNISFNKSGPYSIALYDMAGELIYHKTSEATSNNSHEEIDPGTIPAGIYFLRVSDGLNSFTKKIMVNK